MSDTFHGNWLPSHLNAEFTFKASEAAFVGDLLWYDVANHCLRVASQFADAGSAAPTQQAFAAAFAGVSNAKQLSTDATARNARVVIDEIFNFPCASATFAVGDMVTPTYTAGVLSDQQVTKTQDPSLAIGRVVKEYTAATTIVKVRLTSPLMNGLTRNAADHIIQYNQTGAPSATNSSFFIAQRPLRLIGGTAIWDVAAGGTSTVDVIKDTGTAAMNAGTSILSATINANATARTATALAMAAAAATLLMAPGDRLSVKWNNAIQSTTGFCITLHYVPQP